MTTPQPPASRPMTPAGFLSRMPAGGTDYRIPDPLLADAVADGSHALAVEDRETEAYLAEHNDLKGLYDDDRSVRVEQSANGEVAITLGNQTPIFVFAEDFRRLVNEQAGNALEALPGYVAPDRETEIRREVIEFIGERFYAIAWPSKTEVLNAAAHIAAAREADLARDRDFYQERYVRASEAMTPALGEDVTDEVGQGLISDVTVLVQRYLAAAAREAALQARIDAVRAVVDSHEGDAPGSPMYPLWRAVRAAAYSDTTEATDGNG